MAFKAEIGFARETFTHFRSSSEMSPRYLELDGITGELDYPDDGIEMQAGHEYSVQDTLKTAVEKISDFTDKHPVITSIGVAATLTGANLLLHRMTRPAKHLTPAPQV